jgi:sulfonate transport system permease protein
VAFPPIAAAPPATRLAPPDAPRVETFDAAPTRVRGGGARRGIARLRLLAAPAGLLVAWQALASTGAVSADSSSSPARIAAAAARLSSTGVLWENLEVSLRRAALGLLLGLVVGVVAGTLAGLWRAGEAAFNGPMQILNTVPFLAIVPLMIVWFGIGELPKVLLISLGTVVPVYLNLFGAIRDVDLRLIEMAKAAGVGRWRLVRRVLLPGALPGALVGLRFALAYSVLGLVAAEQINADSGIGYMMTQASTYFRTDEIFLGLAIYAVLGLLADGVVRVLERALLSWRPSFAGA